MTAFDITTSTQQQVSIADGDSVTVEPGVVINNPGTTQYDRFAIFDQFGGNNTITVHGTVQGFVGVYILGEGHNTVDIASDGTATGPNACVEIYAGNNIVTNEGHMTGQAWGLYFGPSPTYDPFADGAGGNSFTNTGTVSVSRQPAIRMVEGGNSIENHGTISSVKSEAIRIQSRDTDAANTIDNTGTITGGNTGVAITTGDAQTFITNSGTITGSIQFGAGDDSYIGSGSSTAAVTVFGDDGKDTITGGFGNDTIIGGLGQDTMAGGGGHDIFVFENVAESTGKAGDADIIVHFDFKKDSIQAEGVTLTSFDHIAALADLQAHHAALYHSSPQSTTYFLVIDENGKAGYQQNHDIIIELKAPLHIPS